MYRRTISAALAVAGFSAVLGLAPSASAAGPVCGASYAGDSISTTITNSSCYRVQARIDRYYNGTVLTVYGPTSAGTSKVVDGRGTLAGNLVREYPQNGDWAGWFSI